MICEITKSFTFAAAKESRKLSHERLILHLGTCQEKTYKPANLNELNQRKWLSD